MLFKWVKSLSTTLWLSHQEIYLLKRYCPVWKLGWWEDFVKASSVTVFNQLKIQVVKTEMSCNYNWWWNSLIGFEQMCSNRKAFSDKGECIFLILRVRQMLRVYLPSLLINYWIKFTNTFNIFNSKKRNL